VSLFLITTLKTMYLVNVALFRRFVFMCDFLSLLVYILILSRVQKQNPIQNFKLGMWTNSQSSQGWLRVSLSLPVRYTLRYLDNG
jgi:hypothetical protein